MSTLHPFRIHYILGRLDQSGAPAILVYDVKAEDLAHAIEQFEADDAHDGASILSVAIDRKVELAGELQRDPDGHGYTLRSDAVCAWLTVDNCSVAVKRTDEGCVVDLYPLGLEDHDAVASTYAFATELAEVALEADQLTDLQRSRHLEALPQGA